MLSEAEVAAIALPIIAMLRDMPVEERVFELNGVRYECSEDDWARVVEMVLEEVSR